MAARPERYPQALKALAIREREIHVVGKPELPMGGTPVFLDVEELPDRDSYYLSGSAWRRQVARFTDRSGPIHQQTRSKNELRKSPVSSGFRAHGYGSEAEPETVEADKPMSEDCGKDHHGETSAFLLGMRQAGPDEKPTSDANRRGSGFRQGQRKNGA
ncbi:MAG: hypothetical protein A3H93_19460 [Rhodocyclales bacterium RIFCSPLOWO2_02_FULL_63_24]|nr:MAG: hypothetical protein A3H93_19460 [Rhodocyclales bacterium RIFCSPLOWO2_02_FULL_63_24]